MTQENPKKLFNQGSILVWVPSLVGIFAAATLFGSKGGLSGILWSVGPIVIGLLYCGGFFLIGRFLTQKISWIPHLILAFAVAVVLVAVGFFLLVTNTAENPGKELGYFAPGETVFSLILFFSAILAALSIAARCK